MSAATVRTAARAGVAAALVYAALKAAWGAGSTFGITDAAAFERFEASFGSLGWLATWGTVALALLAAALLPALTEPWGRRLPRRPLRVAAWTGAAVLAVPGFAGLAESLLTLTGLMDGHGNGIAEWVFAVVYGSFAVLSAALAAAARGARPRPRRRPAAAPCG